MAELVFMGSSFSMSFVVIIELCAPKCVATIGLSKA